MPHEDIVNLMSTGDPDLKPPVLGHAKAIVIVCAAANTSPSNLARSLTQLGVNGIAFQKSVFDGVTKAGYTIKLDDIPNSPDTTLIQVVTVIQNANAS
jgi:rhodanese-related sulfurtransferase